MTERRQVLQITGLAVLGLLTVPACGDRAADPPAPPTPDAQQAEEAALIAAYDAALPTAAPADRETLQRIRDEHVAHLAALGWQGAPPVQTPPTRVTRAQLLRAERRATRGRSRAAAADPDPQRAQVLALIAASEAQHVATLESW
jgi:hypothetical protein